MKKALALILCLVMLLGVFPANSSFAFADEECKDSFYSSDLENSVLSDKIAALTETLISAEQSTSKISSIRTLRDFAGNLYTLIECKPTGYYIFHNASGRFVEWAPESNSPYLGISGEIYYAGPTWYFQRNGTDYTHVMEQTVISLSNPETQRTMAAFSNEIHESLESKKKTDIVEWLADDSITVSSPIRSVSNGGQDDTNASVAFPIEPYDKNVYVKNYSFLYGLRTKSQIGYNRHGNYCGYYALNMLMRYWQNRKGIGLSSQYMNNPVRLSEQLISIGRSLGIGTGTWAYNQKKIAIKFFQNQNIKSYNVSWSYPLREAINEIDNKRPTILSASLPDPDDGSNIAHAVIPYGYQSRYPELYWIMHYGWAGYNYVKVDYMMTVYFAHSVLKMRF